MQHVSFVGQPPMLSVTNLAIQSGDRLTLDQLRECRDSKTHSHSKDFIHNYLRTIAAFLRARYL